VRFSLDVQVGPEARKGNYLIGRAALVLPEGLLVKPYPKVRVAFPSALQGDPGGLRGGVGGNPTGALGGVGKDRQEPRRLFAVEGFEELLCFSECYHL
jgi:hypothetical protein